MLGLESTSVVSARFSVDERTAYLSVGAPQGGTSGFDLYTAERDTATDAFGALTKLSVSTNTDDYWPTVAADGLTMFFESGVPIDGSIANTIWFAHRDSVPGTFTARVPDAFAIVPTRTDAAPYLLGSSLYWMSIGREGATTMDLWTGEVGANGVVAQVRPVGGTINTTTAGEMFPVVSADGLELFFTRETPGSFDDIEVAARVNTSGEFANAVPLGLPVDSASSSEWPSWISPDDCRLYFIRSDSPNGGYGPWHLWVAERAKP
ncbi:hypothetical protein AKJ09_09441 [Labilithrix luteola]|uniref:Uncharacterized protein n=1 Tax=Labilithrix luteola TaxID=1391654 RepID=A0A0K1QAL9_9BACT|nr:hypothetical protein AKJ09_09441 [Labilithrix luteola]